MKILKIFFLILSIMLVTSSIYLIILSIYIPDKSILTELSKYIFKSDEMPNKQENNKFENIEIGSENVNQIDEIDNNFETNNNKNKNEIIESAPVNSYNNGNTTKNIINANNEFSINNSNLHNNNLLHQNNKIILTGQYKENAYGLGVHSDGTGRAFQWQTQDGQIVDIFKVEPNGYGLGVGKDVFGRPVYAIPR